MKVVVICTGISSSVDFNAVFTFRWAKYCNQLFWTINIFKCWLCSECAYASSSQILLQQLECLHRNGIKKKL